MIQFSYPLHSNQNGDTEFREWLENSLDVYKRMVLLRNSLDNANKEEGKRFLFSIIHHKDTIKKTVGCFIELKKLETKFPKNDRIKENYKYWVDTFMMMQTSDVIDIEYIHSGDYKMKLLHGIFQSENVDSLNKRMDTFEMSNNDNHKHKHRHNPEIKTPIYKRTRNTYIYTARGKQMKNKQMKGKQTKSKQMKGKEMKGKEMKGKQTKGKQTKGKQTKGKQTKGKQTKRN